MEERDFDKVIQVNLKVKLLHLWFHKLHGVTVNCTETLSFFQVFLCISPLQHPQGTFLVTQAFSRAMVAAGVPKGSIITVGSIVGKVSESSSPRLAIA